MKATLWLLLALTMVICGCASTQVRLSKLEDVPLVSLASGLRPLQEQFNADKSRLRVMALFSPT